MKILYSLILLLLVPVAATAQITSPTNRNMPLEGYNTAILNPAELTKVSPECRAMLRNQVTMVRYDADGMPTPAYADVRGPECPQGLKVRYLRRVDAVKW